MRLALERIANREGSMVGNGQPVGRGKLWPNIATCVGDDLGMVFKSHEEALFELATERLSDRGSHPHLKAGNPP